jgi:hypothetical protein
MLPKSISPPISNPEADVTLFTDGSGHMDGFGGWAAVVKSRDGKFRDFRMGAMTGTSVDRMEMTAMIEGLHMALHLVTEHPEIRRNIGILPSVLWYSDRESMVKSALGEFGRTNATDIWSQYAWFETQLRIYPVHVLRETEHPEFQAVDLHASTARLIIKNYVSTIDSTHLF